MIKHAVALILRESLFAHPKSVGLVKNITLTLTQTLTLTLNPNPSPTLNPKTLKS